MLWWRQTSVTSAKKGKTKKKKDWTISVFFYTSYLDKIVYVAVLINIFLLFLTVCFSDTLSFCPTDTLNQSMLQEKAFSFRKFVNLVMRSAPAAKHTTSVVSRSSNWAWKWGLEHLFMDWVYLLTWKIWLSTYCVIISFMIQEIIKSLNMT